MHFHRQFREGLVARLKAGVPLVEGRVFASRPFGPAPHEAPCIILFTPNDMQSRAAPGLSTVTPRYPEEADVRSQLVGAVFSRRRATGTRGDELVARYDSEGGHALARDMEADVAAQIASRFFGTPEDLCRRVKARVPSAKPCRMNRRGMNSPETRQQLRTSDIDTWGLKKNLAVAAALGAKRARLVIEW